MPDLAGAIATAVAPIPVRLLNDDSILVSMNGFLFSVSAGLLGAGLLLHLWLSRSSNTGRQHTILVPILLMYSLGATVLVFSLFPTSVTEGSLFGFTAGGAAGFALLVWILAIRWTRPAERADGYARTIARLESEIERLREAVYGRTGAESARPAETVTVSRYRLRGRRRMTVGVLCGNLRNVQDVDVWINSENTHMEMSRATGTTVSALIRHYGSRRDAYGQVVQDVVYDELRAAVAGLNVVAPASAITTSAGELTITNGVRKIVHVAAVEAAPVSGYRAISDIGQCAATALTEIIRLNQEHDAELWSVAMPLFGAGAGRGDHKDTATALFERIIDVLRKGAPGTPRTVYLLAHTDAKRLIFTEILAARTDLIPAG